MGVLPNMDQIDLHVYKEQFSMLQSIVYSCTNINSVGLRILGINFMDFGPGWIVHEHRHTFYEFHYVTENYTYTTINSIEQKVEQGCFYLMPPGTYHSHNERCLNGHVGFSLRWELTGSKDTGNVSADTGTEFEKTKKILENAHTSPICDDGSVISAMLGLLKQAVKTSSMLQLQIAFLQVLLAIAAYYRNKAIEPVSGFCTHYENRTVENAIRFIEENYSQNINVMDVAYTVHMSYSHLSRLFRLQTGQTLSHWLNHTRLLKAQKLLHTTDMTVAQVARETGFASENYFCTSFKKVFRTTPGAYRQGRTMLSE